jgi:hypothetical protein
LSVQASLTVVFFSPRDMWALLMCAAVLPGRATDLVPDAGCSDGPGSCSTPARESVLLQTEHAANIQRLAASHPELLPEWALGFNPDQVPEANLIVPMFVQVEEDMLRSSPSAKELEHFRNVKAERARGFRCPDGTYYPPNNGEFEWDCRLWRAGRGWSTRQGTEGFEGHTHQGSTSCQRTLDQGFPRLVGCGENLALGQATSLEAIAQLKKSKEQCKNFFDPQYNKLGVGFFESRSAKFRYYWTDSFGAWHQPPDQSCIGGSPAPTPLPGCADIDTLNCKTYKNQGYCTVSPNVMSHCKDTCGIGGCGYPAPGSAPAPAPQPSSGGCQDTTGSCDHYRSLGYCANNDNVKTLCKRTCGLCSGASPAPAPPTGSCQDTTGSCDHYRSLGYCANNDNVKTHCKRTCGLC